MVLTIRSGGLGADGPRAGALNESNEQFTWRKFTLWALGTTPCAVLPQEQTAALPAATHQLFVAAGIAIMPVVSRARYVAEGDTPAS